MGLSAAQAWRCLLGAAVVLGALPPGPALAQEISADEAAVRAAAHALGDALARGDSLAVLALLDEDVLILEGGGTETKEEYRSGHLRADIAFAGAATVTRETLREGVTVTGDVALYTRQYRTTGRYRDREIDRTNHEALVLVRTAQGWRIRHVHWS